MGSGKEMVKIALQHVGEDYDFGAEVPMNDPTWDGPWDCAEFVSWCVYQTAKILYGCENNHGNPSTANAYTGFWDRDAKALGKMISIEKAARIPGAVCLRKPAYSGIKVGHVVISDGKGGTVEAMDSNHGVTTSHISGRLWTTGILIPGIEYKESGQEVVVEPAKPAPDFKRLLMLTDPDMEGPDVSTLQTLLNKAGFKLDVDGKFGHKTFNAVLQFQRKKGLVVDGIVGPQTMASLKENS